MTAYFWSYGPDFFSKMILVVYLIISQSFVEFELFSVSRWLAYPYIELNCQIYTASYTARFYPITLFKSHQTKPYMNAMEIDFANLGCIRLSADFKKPK